MIAREEPDECLTRTAQLDDTQMITTKVGERHTGSVWDVFFSRRYRHWVLLGELRFRSPLYRAAAGSAAEFQLRLEGVSATAAVVIFLSPYRKRG
jgi:hypothetical protein